MNNATILKEKKWKYLIILTISILFSIFVSIPANAAVGDLILDSNTLSIRYYDRNGVAIPCTTLLKEGYSLLLDYVVYSPPMVVDFTLYKNEEIVKKMKVKEGDYFYYNKTIGGIEHTIIESKFHAYFNDYLIVLKPFYQYSDGSTIIEPDFVSANLNPKTTEAPSEEWNRTFGGIYDDKLWSVQQTSDNGYVLVGTIKRINSNGMHSNDAWLIKVDVNGNEQWNKTFFDLGDAQSVQQTSDGGFILTGMTGSYEIEIPVWLTDVWFTDTWLLKTDANGNEQWNKTFFDLGGAQSIQQTSDGGFILAGKTGSYEIDTDVWLLKTDTNGTEKWSKTFVLGGSGETSSVRETPDGGYVLAGTIYTTAKNLDFEDPIHIDIDAWLFKTDANGTEQWNRTFGGADSDYAYSVQNTLDGGYILAGRTGSYDAWLFKTDANGNEQWNKTFGLDGFDCAYSVVQTLDGGYVLAGTIDTAKNPDLKDQIHYSDSDAWLFKTDANGNLEWSKTMKRDEARFVQQTSDGGYVIAGTMESYGSGGSDIWLVKVGGMKLDTTQSQVIISDNNVSDNNVTDNNVQTSPGKSIPGFEFFGVVFSVLIILLSRRRII
ncbi:MAG: hypothetical protein E4G94_05565 [ANME-2 cluster archaeon]|nr:MAG: hypothetical protein E4G94_05565 [ANME-2 cluster archaeon]